MKKRKTIKPTAAASYEDPAAPGVLGGVARFARAHGWPLKKARTLLEKNLAYTLYKPRRFITLPVLVFNRDQQWVADLVEMQRVALDNRGMRYLLTVVDVLSKYA